MTYYVNQEGQILKDGKYIWPVDLVNVANRLEHRCADLEQKVKEQAQELEEFGTRLKVEFDGRDLLYEKLNAGVAVARKLHEVNESLGSELADAKRLLRIQRRELQALKHPRNQVTAKGGKK